ncbi:hypothetical protein B0H98_1193 [Vreelandella songnenensis]|uniref:Uncharacterized protein n=1 Tax=Vreelandella songnenensis TaxID=1176243 RepID=A0A2T0UK23_9GAMM|nr:hypothetical protein B0H98_1193 [Halomonas songnenensis]
MRHAIFFQRLGLFAHMAYFYHLPVAVEALRVVIGQAEAHAGSEFRQVAFGAGGDRVAAQLFQADARERLAGGVLLVATGVIEVLVVGLLAVGFNVAAQVFVQLVVGRVLEAVVFRVAVAAATQAVWPAQPSLVTSLRSKMPPCKMATTFPDR